MKKIIIFSLSVIVFSIGFIPVGAMAASQTYTNSDYKVSLNYSGLNMQTKEVTSYIPVQNSLHDSNAVDLLTLYLKPSIYKGTNLEAAIFNLTVSKAVDSTTCYDNALAGVSYNKIRKVQGNKWHYALPNPRGGAATGHSSSAETYRLYKNNVCYEVNLQTSDFSRDASNKKVSKYSQAKVFGRLGAVFNRLKVK